MQSMQAAMMGGMIKQLQNQHVTQNVGIQEARSPPPPRPRTKPVTMVKKCKVIYDYEANDQDELNLLAGDILEIVTEDASGWWTGKNKNGLVGQFPGNYVQKLYYMDQRISNERGYVHCITKTIDIM